MVSVELVDDDMLDAGVIVRFADVSLEDFILIYQKGFVKIIKNILNIKTADVVILSMQQQTNRRTRQMVQVDKLDVLFVIKTSTCQGTRSDSS